MSVLDEIESVVASELTKLKEKLEAMKSIKELEAEILKLKSKLEGDTDAASALCTAHANISKVITAAQPVQELPAAQ